MGAELTTRAINRLGSLREQYRHRVAPDASVVTEDDGRVRWWTFAGAGANAALTAALDAVAPDLLDQGTFGNLNIALRSDATAVAVGSAVRQARAEFGSDLVGVMPPVSEQALAKLKFAELLPPHLALGTLSARSTDRRGAALVAGRPVAGG